MTKTIQTQEEVDAILRRGIVFSLLWLMGIGSLMAVINGFKAKKIIRCSNGQFKGHGRVLWCLIVGGLGLSFWLFVFIRAVINNATH